jgi:hypothetical protein
MWYYFGGMWISTEEPYEANDNHYDLFYDKIRLHTIWR